VITRRRKIKIDQDATTNVLGRHDRELVIRDHERAYRSRHLRRALLSLRERVRSREIQRPERSCSQLDFRAARDAAVSIQIPAKTSERIGRKVDQAREVEDDDPAQFCIEVSC
jgi:hypothetical protein